MGKDFTLFALKDGQVGVKIISKTKKAFTIS
jgi:ribosomal protein L27